VIKIRNIRWYLYSRAVFPCSNRPGYHWWPSRSHTHLPHNSPWTNCSNRISVYSSIAATRGSACPATGIVQPGRRMHRSGIQ